MERVEVFRGHTFVLRTNQVGPERWSCDVFGRESPEAERFLLEEFGDSELEAIAMALNEVHYHH
jgi:hypothetical protein